MAHDDEDARQKRAQALRARIGKVRAGARDTLDSAPASPREHADRGADTGKRLAQAAELTRNPRFGSALAALGERHDVTVVGGDFAACSLEVDGKLFAIVDPEGRVALRLPAERVATAIARGHGATFESERVGPMREWLVVADAVADWPALLDESLHFVKAQSG